MRTIEHWIGGQSIAGSSTRVGPVYNPATGEQQAQVLLATPADVDAAVQAAIKAFERVGAGLAVDADQGAVHLP